MNNTIRYTREMYTRAGINEMLQKNGMAVERAIMRLFTMQNSDEQRNGTANEQNGRGFCSSDARAGTRFARWLQGMDNKNVVRYAPKSLNHGDAYRIFAGYCQNGGTVMDRARKIALKHSQQLVEYANAETLNRSYEEEDIAVALWAAMFRDDNVYHDEQYPEA